MHKKIVNAFTLVELLGVIIILGVIALITFPIINKSIKSSKEKALEQVINNIEDAAYEYSVKNDIGYQTFYNKIELSTLTSAGILKDNIINPVTNEQMQGCVLYKWVEEYNQYEFKYDEICPVKTIGEVVLEQFPYLETNGNGCVTLGDNNYSYMGGCYLKGNLNNNYIWYSGFLWRIMGINADGTIRLITDENVTAIPWGEDNQLKNWDDSYVVEWLNNYFYSRLKGNDVIKEEIWCSEKISSLSVSEICSENLSNITHKVGLITFPEYYFAGMGQSYLNIGQYQWTMTLALKQYAFPDDYMVFSLSSDGNYSEVLLNLINPLGVRPVINIYSDVIVSYGNGKVSKIWNSETSPYILNEDKNVDITGKLNEKATSGEYVLFVNKKYRVVDKDSNGNTKLILDGYYEEDGSIFEMKYNDTSTNEFSTATGIGKKLNGDVLNWLTNNNDTEKGKLVSNYTWYQNIFDKEDNYKVSLDEVNSNKIINSAVGLIRVGEILSSQSSSILTKGYTSGYYNATTYWAMTLGTGINNNWIVHNQGLISEAISSSMGGLRPVIVIKSDVEIIGGTGTFSNPYKI